MSGQPPRVALVSREYPPFFGGGIGTYARWIVPAFNAAGMRVHVITEAHDKLRPRVETEGLTTIHRVPVGIGRGGWTNAAMRFSINAGRKVAQLHRSGQIDAVEFAECEAAGLAHLLTGGRDRPPTIVQLHTPSEQLFVLRSLSSRTLDASLSTYFTAERVALRLADEVLAPSRFIAEWARDHYGLRRRPRTIPYATGPLPPPPPPSRIAPEPIVFYAGRIEPRKGVEALIRAWNAVAAEHPEARLHLAGADTSGAPDGGSMRAYLAELLGEHARPRVRFLGRLNHDALSDEYARASICVIPSLWENFPNVCIESMSSARPVLAGDQGGMREMIGDSDAGLTFAAGDEQDLARTLSRMLLEPRDRLVERGRIARKRIEQFCDPRRIADLRIDHFRSVLGRRREISPADAVLDCWKDLERIAERGEPVNALPPLSGSVRRWVEREEAPACGV